MIQQSLLNLRRHATRLLAFLFLTVLGIGQMWADVYTIEVSGENLSSDKKWYQVENVGGVTNKTGSTWSSADYTCTPAGAKTGSSNFTVRCDVANVKKIEAICSSTSARTVSGIKTGSSASNLTAPDAATYTISGSIAKNACDQTISVEFTSALSAGTYVNFTLSGNANVHQVVLTTAASAKYTVTFDANDGDCDTESLTEASAGAGVTLPSATPATGYDFLGWATEDDATEAEYEEGDTYKPTANITLYAVYAVHVTKYAVNFDAGDGTGEMASRQYAEGATVTLPSCGFTAPAGKIFAGWSDGVNTYDAGDEFTMSAQAVTFTAQWKKAVGLITKTATTGSKNQTITGVIANTEATNLVNIAGDMKLGGSGQWIGVALKSGYTFVAGDIINVHTTKAGAQGNIAIYSNTGKTATKIVDLVADYGVLGDNEFALPEGIEAYNTLYICRTDANNWNGYVDFVSVTRHGDVTSEVYAGKVVVDDEEATIAAVDNVITIEDSYTEAPEVALVKTVTYEDETVMDEKVAVEFAAEVDEGFFVGTATIGTTVYTVKAAWTAPATIYYIAGNGTNENGWCGGKEWDATEESGLQMEHQDNGTYTYTATVPAGTYLFKVATAGWAASWGSDNLNNTNGVTSDGTGDKNVQFTTYAATEVTVTFDPNKNNEGENWKTISVSANKPLHAIPYVASSVNGWQFALMDESDDTKWQKTFANVTLNPADTYIKYKYTKEGNWTGGFWWKDASHSSDDENAYWGISELAAGVYDVTFEYTPFTPATNVVLTRKYQVTYAAGEGATGSVAPVYSAAGNLTLAAKGDLEKTGYKFAGWSDGVNTYAAGATYTVSTDVTLTAQWEVIPTISEPTVWDFSKLGIAEVKLTESTTPARGQLISYSDYNFENADPSFNLDALETRTEYMVRETKYAQGPYMHFVTTVPGVVVVEFCNTGSSNGTRSLAVNGVTTEYGASNANFVTTGQIAVAAGDVELNGIQTAEGGSTAVGNEAYLRWKKISFYPTYSRANVQAGKFGTICLPYAVSEAAVTASGFTFYNIESKTVVDGSLKSIALAEQTSLEAGVPYLFEAPAGEGTTTLTLALSGNKVNAVTDQGGLVGTLTGGLEMPTVAKNANAYFVSTNDNKLHRLTGTATATIGANKAYIDLTNVSEAVPAAPARIIYAADYVDQATGLDNLNATDMQKFMQDGKLYIRVADRIYDATGRLVK